MLPAPESKIDPADISLPPTQPIDITAYIHDGVSSARDRVIEVSHSRWP